MRIGRTVVRRAAAGAALLLAACGGEGDGKATSTEAPAASSQPAAYSDVELVNIVERRACDDVLSDADAKSVLSVDIGNVVAEPYLYGDAEKDEAPVLWCIPEEHDRVDFSVYLQERGSFDARVQGPDAVTRSRDLTDRFELVVTAEGATPAQVERLLEAALRNLATR